MLRSKNLKLMIRSHLFVNFQSFIKSTCICSVLIRTSIHKVAIPKFPLSLLSIFLLDIIPCFSLFSFIKLISSFINMSFICCCIVSVIKSSSLGYLERWSFSNSFTSSVLDFHSVLMFLTFQIFCTVFIYISLSET